MIVVGVTGNLASGKSEVAMILKKRGAKIFDADLAARNVVQVGKPVYRAIVKIFGKAYLKKDRALDRKKLAERVFLHPSELKKLNILIHPGVIFECFQMIERYKDKKGVLVLDVPLLFESKMENLADYTIVIDSSRSKIFKRAKKKGLPENLVKKILSAQWPVSKKSKHADFVITNNGTAKQLEKKVWEVMDKIKKKHALNGN